MVYRSHSISHSLHLSQKQVARSEPFFCARWKPFRPRRGPSHSTARRGSFVLRRRTGCDGFGGCSLVLFALRARVPTQNGRHWSAPQRAPIKGCFYQSHWATMWLTARNGVNSSHPRNMCIFRLCYWPNASSVNVQDPRPLAIYFQGHVQGLGAGGMVVWGVI